MRTRYELTVHLRTSSPLHSGGIDVPVDRARGKDERRAKPQTFARDALGNPVLTGRSVEGALRAAYERQVTSTNGATEQAGKQTQLLWGGKDRAAALTFHPVELDGEHRPSGDTGPDGPQRLPERTGIAVNRYWGAAGDTALFVHEYVPAGRQLTLTISAQAGAPDEQGGTSGEVVAPEQVEQLLGTIIGLFRAGRVSFGGRRNAGWGRVELDGDRAWTLTKSELGSPDGLLTWLKGGTDITDQLNPADCGGDELVRISVEWQSPTGILVAEPRPEVATPGPGATGPEDPGGQAKDGTAQAAEDETEPARPLRCGPGENDLLVLPGSSVRGALRSRASRIARTVLAAHGGVEDWSETGVHDQLASDPVLVRELFGSTSHRGALTVLDTLATGHGAWRKVTHNAGDRWTGGVADGALYSEEVHDVAWNRIELEFDVGMLPPMEGRRRAAWCLLGITLAELATGTLPLGRRGARGLGQVTVTGITVEGGHEIVGEAWNLKASGDRTLPEQILSRLQQVTIETNPAAGDGWDGWSSYLVENPEHGND